MYNRNSCLNNQNISECYCTSGSLFVPPTRLCVCTFVHDRGHAVAPYPVYNQDLADVELMLELLGCDGHRVEVTEAPVDKQTGRVAATCVYLNIFSKLISQHHHMELRSHSDSFLALCGGSSGCDSHQTQTCHINSYCTANISETVMF